jgi:hypothetical protein
MYEHDVHLTTTYTLEMDDHYKYLRRDVRAHSGDGWELVQSNTVIRGPKTETLTFWKREKQTAPLDASGLTDIEI